MVNIINAVASVIIIFWNLKHNILASVKLTRWTLVKFPIYYQGSN